MAGKITIVGLGPGDPDQLTLAAYRVLSNANTVYCRTRHHPTLDSPPFSATIESFDWTYEQGETFDAAYRLIAGRLIDLASENGGKDIVYAVPGDPSVGETSVAMIRESAPKAGVEISIIHGLSFIEPALAALGVDPLTNGLQLIDGMAFEGIVSESLNTPQRLMRLRPPLDPTKPALISQIYNQRVASAIKLGLLEYFGDRSEVTVVRNAGLAGQQLKSMPLYQLDWADTELDHLTLLYVPGVEPEECLRCFRTLEWVIARLRAPGGCPWDREQTHHTLKPHLIEETYEVVEALDADDPAKLEEELGDLLLQVVLHAEISTEDGDFDMGDVIAGISEKLMRRHPHVFGTTTVSGSGEVLKNWEEIKRREREQAQAEGGEDEEEIKSILSGVPKAMPALSYAQLIQQRAARVGFDWPQMSGVVDKVKEEIGELAEAKNRREQREELGDILFSLVNFARWLDVDAEDSLRLTNQKFYRRFYEVERLAMRQGKKLSKMTIEELDCLWEQAKSILEPDAG